MRLARAGADLGGGGGGRGGLSYMKNDVCIL